MPKYFVLELQSSHVPLFQISAWRANPFIRRTNLFENMVVVTSLGPPEEGVRYSEPNTLTYINEKVSFLDNINTVLIKPGYFSANRECYLDFLS